MYRKIFVYMFILSVFTLLFISFLIMFDFYFSLPTQFFESIKSIRVLIIDTSCKIKFQNWASANSSVDVCLNPEIQNAFKRGFATSFHYSTVLHNDAFYLAIRINPDQVLRFTISNLEFQHLTHNIIRDYILSVCMAFILVLIIAWIATKRIISPFNNISNDEITFDSLNQYPELNTFISRIKEQENTLIQTAKYRTQFSANVSHELKTPLAEIMSMAQVIEKCDLDEAELKDSAKDIVGSSKRLLNMINDILELSRFDEASLNLKKEKVSINELVNQTISAMTKQKEKKSLEFEIKASDPNVEIMADKTLYQIVIKNLVENAIKYSYAKSAITILITDYGLSINNMSDPISEDALPKLFERFYRTDEARTVSSETGYGVGLAFVYNIVKAHGGDIEVFSTKEDGTTFNIKF